MFVFGSAVFFRRLLSDEVARARFGVAITDVLLKNDFLNNQPGSLHAVAQLITISRLYVDF
jgi:hypothetical protein